MDRATWSQGEGGVHGAFGPDCKIRLVDAGTEF